MAAHSYHDRRRTWNVETFGGYCRGVEERGARGARAGERLLSPREHRSEALFTGLRRRDGVDVADFARRYGVDPLAEHGALGEALDTGLLERLGTRLRLTDRGVLLSNEVFSALV